MIQFCEGTVYKYWPEICDLTVSHMFEYVRHFSQSCARISCPLLPVMLPDVTGDSDSSDEEMFDPANWRGEKLNGWPIKDTSDYYHLVPFGGSTVCNTTELLGVTSYSHSLIAHTEELGQEEVDSVNTEDIKNVDPQSTDGEEDPSFIPPQSKHGNNKPEAKWEDMDKASQARLTVFYELHKCHRRASRVSER